MRTLKKIPLQAKREVKYVFPRFVVDRLMAEGVAEIEVSIDDVTSEIKIKPVREAPCAT